MGSFPIDCIENKYKGGEMPVSYYISIEPTGKENLFHIIWQHSETNTVNSFDQEAEITPDEAQRLWQYSQHQTSIGEKLFRFLDGDSRCLLRALDETHQQAESLQLNLHACNQIVDWPFELLAESNKFVLLDRLHLVRQVSDWGSSGIGSRQSEI